MNNGNKAISMNVVSRKKSTPTKLINVAKNNEKPKQQKHSDLMLSKL